MGVFILSLQNEGLCDILNTIYLVKSKGELQCFSR